ncbi:Uma2 family endonuclease [Scytonema sp. NUACC26]|uniref:Uma2 family endonuclease n=1 Tax=Scytonema sp. NUACC26 TaxID=3140176 RepID=UPI0034DC6472
MSQPLATTSTVENATQGIIFPPGDLYSDEPPLESDLHREQIELLVRLIKWYWRERQDFYATGNLTVYFSPNQKKSEAKLKLYSLKGVQEYWIADWRLQQIEIYRKDAAQLRLVATLLPNDDITSPLLLGFSARVQRLFA